MIVAELVEKLRACPQDMRVVVDGYEGDFDDPEVKEAIAVIDAGFDAQHLDVGSCSGFLMERRKSCERELVVVIARS